VLAVAGKKTNNNPRTTSAMFPDYLSVKPEELGCDTGVKVQVVGDTENVARHFAKTVFDEITQKPDVTVILPVGPVDQFPILAEMINADRLDCRNVTIINMDEYLTDEDEWVPAEHPLSFRSYMDRMFYNRVEQALAPRPENRIFPDPTRPEAVQQTMDDRGGVDTCYGDIGINGHVAFNEPPESDEPANNAEFASRPTRVLSLSRETRTINSNTAGGELSIIPTRAVTVGMSEILAARRLRLYANRPWQSAVIRRVLHGPRTARCPASVLRTHEDIGVVLADYVAAAPNIRLR